MPNCLSRGSEQGDQGSRQARIIEGRYPESNASRLSLDLLRILAISLVATLHLISITGEEQGLIVDFLTNFRQMGVTTLCALSGWLAAQTDEGRRTRNWLARRLLRVFPSYWISIAAILAANQVIRYKALTWEQVICQFLGIGLLTHPNSLVGVHTWFITLIILCYIMGAVARRWKWTLPFLVGLVIWQIPAHTLLAGHSLSFLGALGLGWGLRRWGGRAAGFAAVWLGLLCWGLSRTWDRTFLFPAVGITCVWVCAQISMNSMPTLRFFSVRTYEFYLVHGPIYLV